MKHSLPLAVLPAALALALPAHADGNLARLGHTVVPTSESIHLTVDPAQTDYSGSVRIAIRVTAACDSFQLNARHLTVTRATLRRGAAAAKAATWNPADHERITIHAARALAPGDYTLDLEFTNAFDTKAAGLYKLESNGDPYAFTQFESTDARQAFPCWDEPEFKIPWQLTLTVPQGRLALANTPITTTATHAGLQDVAFEQTPPMPSYLVAFAVGPFETVDVPGTRVPCRIVVVKGQTAMTAEAVKMVPPILAALEGYFGSSYPFKKLDFIGVPEYNFGAMENPGAVTFLDRILLIDPERHTDQQRRQLARDIAHELSHMWFGDLVTMKWWDDLWLNESFANWMGDKTTNAVFPEFNMPVFEMGGTARAYETDNHTSTRAVRQPVGDNTNLDQLADALAYDKGQAVLDMFEAWIGPDTFRQGVIAYLHAHAWGNAEASDLWSALAQASGQDLGGALSTYLDQPGVPLVTLDLLPNHQVRLSQQRFFAYGETAKGATTWKIPVVFSFSDGAKTYTQRVMLTDASTTVTLAPAVQPVWIHPNAGERGYYHWALAPEMQAALATRGRRDLNERERVGLVNEAATMLEGGMMHGDDYLRTLSAFGDDASARVVGRVLDGLQEVRFAMTTPELRVPFAAFLQQTLHPTLDRLGPVPKPGENLDDTGLRARLMTTLGVWGQDDALRAQGLAMTRKYLADPTSVPPSLVDASLRLAATSEDPSLYDEFRRRFEAAKSPTDRSRFLRALGGFHDPKLVDATLAYALTGPLRPQEIAFGLQNFDDDALIDRVWGWAQTNYTALAARMPPMFRIYMVYYAAGCSAQRLEAAKAFFALPEHAPLGTAQELAKMSDQVTSCVTLREREGPRVAKMLTEPTASK